MIDFVRLETVALAVLCVACQPVKVGGEGDGGIDGGEGADARVSYDAEVDAVPPDPCVGDVAFEDAAECYHAAICDMYSRCLGLFSSIEECMGYEFGRLNPETMFRQFGDAIAADKMNYNGVAAGECFATIHAADCAILMEGDGPGPACDLVFAGTAADTEPCYQSDECLDGYCQESDACYLQCCIGTCQADVALGFSCEGRNCVSGAHCVQTVGAGYLCQTGETGSPCSASYHCDQGFWCDLTTSPGVCTADFPANASCSDDDQCPLPQLCVGDDTSAGIGTCKRADTLAAQCDDQCYGPFYCNVINLGELGNCSPYPGLAQSCAVTNHCAGLLVCNPNTYFCVERVPLHGACTDTNACQLGLICTSELPNGPDPGQCENPLANGQPCNYNEHCVSQVCAGSPRACEAYDNCYD